MVRNGPMRSEPEDQDKEGTQQPARGTAGSCPCECNCRAAPTAFTKVNLKKPKDSL